MTAGRPVRVASSQYNPLMRFLPVVVALVAAGACAPARMRLPSGPGSPMPDYEAAFARASKACVEVRTMTAELALSGRAGRTKIRGRVLAGLAAGSVRLEGVAPFGQPAFILVSRPSSASGGSATESTLLLPRDGRVLNGAAPEKILAALAGIEATPDELRAILAGCVAPGARAVGARAYGDEWMAFDLEGGGTAYVRQSQPDRLAAGQHAGLTMEYRDLAGGSPGQIRLLSSPSGQNPPVDLTVRVSQVETNTALEAAAFTVVVPPDAMALTLDELRDAGPLGAAGR